MGIPGHQSQRRLGRVDSGIFGIDGNGYRGVDGDGNFKFDAEHDRDLDGVGDRNTEPFFTMKVRVNTI